MNISCHKDVVQLSVEVGHLVGLHKERYLEKLNIAGLHTDPYLFVPDIFTELAVFYCWLGE